MGNLKNYQSTLESTWHRDTAQASLERWLSLCEQEDWGETPRNMELLIRIFGASWYFTRFIYVNGREVAELVDKTEVEEFTTAALYDYLIGNMEHDSLEVQLERLRYLKNCLMFRILVLNLSKKIEQEQTEYALTCLAEATLQYMVRLFKLSPGLSESPISVLGMGRMAGHEMTFGSDLDLIFLYSGNDGEIDPRSERAIRSLLRNISLQSPMGILYEVDMRLRPHGNAGILVTSHKSFLEYHSEKRDIWERQMMTRCRPVLNINAEVESLMKEVGRHIYTEYDNEHLKQEIIYMRKRVQKELGSQEGKYDVKRGKGGIMDIDFICHYLQLANGHTVPALQTPATRDALRALHKMDYIDEKTQKELLESYDFLKKIEMSLRLFDMKPVSAFPVESKSTIALSRAMGFYANGSEDFINTYKTVTSQVRNNFKKILGDPDL